MFTLVEGLDNTLDTLYNELIRYSNMNYYPMHMPGHKRNTSVLSMVNPYSIDITEIEGFDNLHKAEGIIKQLSLRLANLYKAKWSYPLVNGSTAGILAGISAATRLGDKVLMSRNSHSSVYNAVIINQLKPIFIYPSQVKETPVLGGISPVQIENLLIENPDISLVIITSPTYEGIVSDVDAISKVVHQYGALLLVDEAHGAHFGFHYGFPKSSVRCGADIIIQSLHKTLPSFTQTAVLHTNQADIILRLEKYLTIYQSSSPSYLLMAGMDRCVSLLEEKAIELFRVYYENLTEFYRLGSRYNNIRLLNQNFIGKNDIYDMDLSKLTIYSSETRMTGAIMESMLRNKYRIVMEMQAVNYVLGITSICDTREGFLRLIKALKDIDKEISLFIRISSYKKDQLKSYYSKNSTHWNNYYDIIKPIQVMLPYEAINNKTEIMKISESAGRIAASHIGFYPPGIPLIIPGELIEAPHIELLKDAINEGYTLTGVSGEKKDMLEVMCE